jgi:hypothetical protein
VVDHFSAEARQALVRRIRDRAFGLGRHGFIAVSYVTLWGPAPARFVVAHEAGHVARRDSVRVTTAAWRAHIDPLRTRRSVLAWTHHPPMAPRAWVWRR